MDLVVLGQGGLNSADNGSVAKKKILRKTSDKGVAKFFLIFNFFAIATTSRGCGGQRWGVTVHYQIQWTRQILSEVGLRCCRRQHTRLNFFKKIVYSLGGQFCYYIKKKLVIRLIFLSLLKIKSSFFKKKTISGVIHISIEFLKEFQTGKKVIERSRKAMVSDERAQQGLHFERATKDFSTSLDGCGRRLRSTWTANNFGGCQFSLPTWNGDPPSKNFFFPTWALKTMPTGYKFFVGDYY